MRPRDSLFRAFDLINQTVTACYDGNAGIRVLGPLLVAEQELRTELGPDAAEATARAASRALGPARALPTPIAELEWMCARIGGSAALVISRVVWAFRRGEVHGVDARWAAVAVAAFAAYAVLTPLPTHARDDGPFAQTGAAQASVLPIEKIVGAAKSRLERRRAA